MPETLLKLINYPENMKNINMFIKVIMKIMQKIVKTMEKL
jgi:hypothetical protein